MNMKNEKIFDFLFIFIKILKFSDLSSLKTFNIQEGQNLRHQQLPLHKIKAYIKQMSKTFPKKQFSLIIFQ